MNIDLYLGRKGKLTEIILRFSDTDFHHLAGLHKLKDIGIARANRSAIFWKILNGHISYDMLEKSQFLPNIKGRLSSLPYLESFLDGNQIIFRYNKKVYPYSAIEGEYLLKMGDGAILGITLLKKEKCNLRSGQILVQYDRLSPK